MSHPAATKQSRLRAPCKANPKLKKGLSLIFPSRLALLEPRALRAFA